MDREHHEHHEDDDDDDGADVDPDALVRGVSAAGGGALVVLHLAHLAGLVVEPGAAAVLVLVGVGSRIVARSSVVFLEIQLKEAGEGDGCQDAHAGGQRQHEAHHDSGEVDRAHRVQHDEDTLVVDVFDDIP